MLKKKYLVIRRFGSVGDLLMLTPALYSLSKKFEVHLQVPDDFVACFDNLSFISKLIPMSENVDKKGYFKINDVTDYEFDYEQTSQPEITLTKQEIFAQALQVKCVFVAPKIVLTKDERKWVKKYCAENGLKRFIVLAVRSANAERDWSLDNWKTLIERLKRLNYELVVVDKFLSWDDSSIHFFNNHSIRELFALVSQSKIVIGQDSGILHIAGAFRIPNVTIFGATDYKLRSIYHKSYYVASNNLPCYPCWYKRCPDCLCLKTIDVMRVENKILEAISNER